MRLIELEQAHLALMCETLTLVHEWIQFVSKRRTLMVVAISYGTHIEIVRLNGCLDLSESAAHDDALPSCAILAIQSPHAFRFRSGDPTTRMDGASHGAP